MSISGVSSSGSPKAASGSPKAAMNYSSSAETSDEPILVPSAASQVTTAPTSPKHNNLSNRTMNRTVSSGNAKTEPMDNYSEISYTNASGGRKKSYSKGKSKRKSKGKSKRKSKRKSKSKSKRKSRGKSKSKSKRKS